MVPNEYQFVCDHVGPRLAIVGDEEQTRANSFWAVNDACNEIRKKDVRWGLLIKTGGAQVEQRAADVWLYNLLNGQAQVVDIVGNAEGAAPPEGGERGSPVPSWGEADLRGINEWVEPYPSSVAPPEPIPPTPSEDYATQAELDEVKADLASLQNTVDEIVATLAGGLRAHGPVNLPIVFQDITHLRAKGDIDVEVKTGTPAPADQRVADEGEVTQEALREWTRRP